VSHEGEFARVLFHQGPEALERDNLAQRDVNGLGAGFYTKDLGGFIGKLGIEADRGERDRHDIYTLLLLYICVKRAIPRLENREDNRLPELSPVSQVVCFDRENKISLIFVHLLVDAVSSFRLDKESERRR
jgi:hypothetical protein